ncbi:hypothetical protein QI849_001040 [Listeria innocua]|nr:hypothetical protein [Listeria innocua]EHF3606786.1 hypothetical protein [Listeria innocua]EHM7936646.1 hypothetical protein [Listeria innocua]EHR9820783.1 hypothetical protein [Listeria innocua]EHR9825141.1 hypothetical protein [Listeria innocua]
MKKIESEIKRQYNDILANFRNELAKKYKYTRYIIIIIYFTFAILIGIAKINFIFKLISCAILIISLFLVMQHMQKKTLQSLGFKSMRDYLKSELRKTFIKKKLFHSQLLKPIISSLDNKTTIKFNPALLISFLFFIFNPFWNYLINKQLEGEIALSKITSFTLLLLTLLIILFAPPYIIYKILIKDNKDLLAVLNDLLYEAMYKEINKSSYFYTGPL